MKMPSVSLCFAISLALMFACIWPLSANACSCGPYDNQSLCQLGDEANLQGARANFMAVVELGDSTISGDFIIYSLNVVELLAGEMPTGDVELVQFGLEWSCAQYDIIEPRARGVLVANLVDDQAMPSFCTLQHSFFRMVGDTVFVPLFGERFEQYDQPYTLEEFRTGSCENFSASKEISAADESFALAYNPQNEELEIISLDQTLRSEKLSVDIYASSGRHLLEVKPPGPFDVSFLPPGMYAILIRDRQQAWSKAFVKSN